MDISGEFTLNGPRQVVWDTLNDPAALEKAIPGLNKLTLESKDSYQAEMSVGVGIIRGKFGGSVKAQDKAEPESYRLIVEGKGPAGWVKGDGALKLAEAGENKTIVTVDGEASVGGMLARVGQRMVRNVANSLMKQFFQEMDKQVAAKNKT